LDGKVDVDGGAGAASDLDAVGERGGGAVGPARATVLRKVLVEGLGEVRLAIHSAP